MLVTFSCIRHDFNSIFYIWASFFHYFYENVLPAKAGSTFPNDDFCQHRVQDGFSMPKMVSKPSLLRVHFRPVLLKKQQILPTERKMGVLGGSVQRHLNCRMLFGLHFHHFFIFFQKCAPCLGSKHDFENRPTNILHQKCHILDP